MTKPEPVSSGAMAAGKTVAASFIPPLLCAIRVEKLSSSRLSRSLNGGSIALSGNGLQSTI
jgi:hypothetical protein